MTTYTWPNAQWAKPAQCNLQVIDNLQRVNESPLSGYTQSLAMPGTRWGWSLTWPPQNAADREQLEAMLISLDGRANRVRLWDFKRPRPRGTIATSGVTLASTAAQFSTSLDLAGCLAANNLLRASDALSAAPWSTFHASVTANQNTSPFGGVIADKVQSLAAGNDFVYQAVALTPGQTYTVTAYIANFGGTSGSKILIRQAVDNGEARFTWTGPSITGTELVTGVAADATVDSAGWWRVRLTFVAAESVAWVRVYPDTANAGGNISTCAVQLEAGASPTPYLGSPTLLRGDWLGLSSQLVRAVEDATANDAGQMTVQVRHMLRNSAASGSAVTLERPTALYMRTESGLLMPRQPGLAEPELQCDFVEAFA